MCNKNIEIENKQRINTKTKNYFNHKIKLFIPIFLLLTTNNCVSGPYTAQGQADLVKNSQSFLQSSQTINQSKNQNINATPRRKEVVDLLNGDNSDLIGCHILTELGKWEIDEYKNGIKVWGRRQAWLSPYGNLETITGFSVDFYRGTSTPQIQTETHLYKEKQKPSNRFVYIGPWKHIVKIDKEIRFFAYTGSGGGDLFYQYESRNSENEKIKEQPFSIVGVPPTQFGLCLVKWTSKHGYNAIAENHREIIPGFWNWIFRNHQLKITGKIIEAEE